MEYVGIDLHHKYSDICWLSEGGEVKLRRRLPTTAASFRSLFRAREKVRVIVENSSESPWVARLLRSCGHDPIVVNTRRVRLIAESTLKNDAMDAEILARLGRLDLGLLRPVYQRSEAAQRLRTRLGVRNCLVKSRTAMINTVRGSLRSAGVRMPSCTPEGFVARFAGLEVPEDLCAALEPLVHSIGQLCERLCALDRELKEEASSDELLVRLQTVPGVGPLVSLAFLAWVDRPERFSASRQVGACLGLRPKMRDSGGRQRRGSITKEGDHEMRRLLVQAAHAAMNCRSDSTLKRWAQELAQRAGRKKAVIALARKLAVLMHRMWITGESFHPFTKADATT